MYKFTGFTQKANDVLNAAIEYAENMGHTYIGSEHLLLGFLEQNGGVAYTVLTNKKTYRRQGRGRCQKQYRIRRADGADSRRFYAQVQEYH